MGRLLKKNPLIILSMDKLVVTHSELLSPFLDLRFCQKLPLGLDVTSHVVPVSFQLSTGFPRPEPAEFGPTPSLSLQQRGVRRLGLQPHRCQSGHSQTEEHLQRDEGKGRWCQKDCITRHSG